MGEPRFKLFDEGVRDEQQLLSVAPHVDPRDNLLTLKLARTDSLWRTLLDIQFHVTKFSELEFYYTDTEFMAARRVLEIGFGDQDEIIGGIGPFFPDKEHDAVSLPTNLILSGKQRTKDILARIEKKFSAQRSRKFDFIILRVILQKITQIGYFIQSIQDYLSESGCIVVMDAHDEGNLWQPPIPELDRLFQTLEDFQKRTGTGRSAAEKMRRRASQYNLTCERNEKLKVAFRQETELKNLFTYYLLLSETINRAYGEGTIDQLKLLSDLTDWIGSAKPYGQFGLQYLKLGRSE